MGDTVVSKSSHFLLLSLAMMFRPNKYFQKILLVAVNNLSKEDYLI